MGVRLKFARKDLEVGDCVCDMHEFSCGDRNALSGRSLQGLFTHRVIQVKRVVVPLRDPIGSEICTALMKACCSKWGYSNKFLYAVSIAEGLSNTRVICTYSFDSNYFGLVEFLVHNTDVSDTL